jgi:hypothetical protein
MELLKPLKSIQVEGSKQFPSGNIKNRNGRMYPMETLSREVSRYNENHVVQQGRALGELGHPDGPTVNLDRVSHKIVSLTKKVVQTLEERQKFLTPQWVRLQESH